MNKNGHPSTLVSSHPGNTNAMKHGVYSERRIQPRAAEIFAEFVQAFEFSVAQRLAVWEVARSTALIEAIDHELDERGLTNKRGEAHSLLNYRARISRQLLRWLSEIAPTIDRQSVGGVTEIGRDEFIGELKRIASGKDATASAHDRVAAIRELLRAEAPRRVESEVAVVRIIREEDGTERVEFDADTTDDPIDLDA